MKKKGRIRVWFFLALSVLGFFNSCQKDLIEENETDVVSTENLFTNYSGEVAFPGKTGIQKEITMYGEKIMVEEIEGKYVLFGDIVLDPLEVEETNKEENKLERSFGRARGRYSWPRNTVVYDIDPGLPNQQRIIDAIAHIEQHTNLYFEKRTNQTGGYVLFQKGVGCSSSWIGHGGSARPQYITLSDSCSTGTVIHEIGHAIGFWHEHQRDDRNSYVRVNRNNIESGKAHNFNFVYWLFWGPPRTDYTPDLDFNSIMMYGPCFFSKNVTNCNSSTATITKLDGSLYNINRQGLSPGDITGFNERYSRLILENLNSVDNHKENNPQLWRSGDFTDDGKSDAARISFDNSYENIEIEVSDRSDSENHTFSIWYKASGNFSPNDQWLAGNFMGNGLTNLVRLYEVNGQLKIDLYVNLPRSNEFVLVPNMEATIEKQFDINAKWSVGDFDGDGTDDFARVSNNNARIDVDVYTLGSGEFVVKKWYGPLGDFKNNDIWLAGDFDGDDKDDLVLVRNNNGTADINFFKSNNLSFSFPRRWATAQGAIWEDMNWLAGDFDGDGVDDIAKSFDQFGEVAIDVHRSNGNQFILSRWLNGGGNYKDRSLWNWVSGDFDGNEKDDLVFARKSSNQSAIISSYISYAKEGRD